MNKKFREVMESFRKKKGVDIASDYYLVVADIKLKLKKHRTIGKSILKSSIQRSVEILTYSTNSR